MAIDWMNNHLWGDDIPWLIGLREKGQRVFEQLGWPNAKTEAWKYSYFPQQILDNLMVCPDSDSCQCHENCHCHDKIKTPFAAYGIKFCNGRLHSEHVNLPEGVIVKPLVEAIYEGEVKKYINKSFDLDKFPFAALNTAFLENGMMLIVERGVKLSQPIFIHYQQHQKVHTFNNIRNIIVLEKGASATITEHYEGERGSSYFNNIVNEIYAHDESKLRHYVVNNESETAYHVALNAADLRANASYEAFVMQGECAFCRHESYIRLLQKGAMATVNGAYQLCNNGISDITTNIFHLASNTDSQQLVKGVADGRSKGVFQGKIHIAPNIKQSEGHQQHRALLLSDNAEIDAKPELEIFAEDVKCSHGNTCGDLDAEQLFYMQSRGISLDDAKRILIKAHVDEAVATISDTKVKNWLLNIITKKTP